MFTCLFLISTLRSEHIYWSIVEVENIGLLIISFCLFIICFNSIDKDKLIFLVYIFALTFSILTFIQCIILLRSSYIHAQGFGIHGLISGYVNVRFFNQLQVMLIPLLLLPFYFLHLFKFRIISIIIMALHWMVILQSEARGSLISLIFVAVLLYFILPRESRKNFSRPLLQSMLLGILLWLILIIAIPSWLIGHTDFKVRTGSSGRLDLWLYVIRTIPEHLWFGYGPMAFAWAPDKPLPHAHPHNAFMQLLYEYGVITTVLVSSGLLIWIYRKLRHLQKDMEPQNIVVMYSILSGIVYSMFSGVIVMPFSQLILTFLFAFISKSELKTCYKMTNFTRFLIFLYIVSISTLLFNSYQTQDLEGVYPKTLYPRIWVNGVIN